MRSLKLLLALFVPISIVNSLRAQEKLNTEVQITKIESTFIEAPKFVGTGYSKKTTGRPKSWLEVEVTFERNPGPKSPKFADELTFDYYILLKNEHVNKDRKPTLLKGTITHIHIPEGKDLHVVAYVSPRTLARFFDGKVPANAAQALTDVGVTISDGTGMVAIATAKGTVRGGKGWWDNSALYSPISGFVFNKTETPFAPLEWDFYEVVKPRSSN